MELKMKTGLSGPEMSLAPGDTKTFDDVAEAQRLIDADFAELAPVAETPAERVVRLKKELKEAEADAKAAPAAGA